MSDFRCWMNNKVLIGVPSLKNIYYSLIILVISLISIFCSFLFSIFISDTNLGTVDVLSQRILYCGRAVFCILGCLAVSLASPQILVAKTHKHTHTRPLLWQQKTSPNIARCPLRWGHRRGAKSPLFEKHLFRWIQKTYLLNLKHGKIKIIENFDC